MIDKFEGDYAFLSNFFYSPITIEGKRYLTVENYFQSMKAANPEDAEEIRLAPKPGESKRLGRHCVIRKDWEDIKEDIMYKGVKAKFMQNPNLRTALEKTEDAWLEEGNTWHDNTWGVCRCIKCQDKMAYNKLGKILMRVRKELKEGN